MSSRFHKRGSRANISPRWTCCKCSTFNPRGRHTCDGILPFHDVYDRACNHWRCPGCLTSNNDNLARSDGRSAPPPPPPSTAVYTTTTYPPPEPAASQIPHHPLLSQYPPPHNSHPHTPSSRFSYTTAYLQSAASRPNNITFAEAFPAPTSAPVTDPTVALGNLRLDYSTGGYHYHHHDEHEGSNEEENDDEQQMMLTPPRQQRNGPTRDGTKRGRRSGKDRDTVVRYYTHGNQNGDEVRKDKEKDMETGTEIEIETEMEAERRRREKGKGKETNFGPFQYQYQHPLGYRPVTVEDALEDEQAGCYYRGDDEMEEEW